MKAEGGGYCLAGRGLVEVGVVEMVGGAYKISSRRRRSLPTQSRVPFGVLSEHFVAILWHEVKRFEENFMMRRTEMPKGASIYSKFIDEAVTHG